MKKICGTTKFVNYILPKTLTTFVVRVFSFLFITTMLDYLIVGSGLAGISFAEIALKNNKSILLIDNKSQNLAAVIRSQSLFEKSRLIVLENLNLLSKKDLVWLKKEAESYNDTLIILQRQTIGKTLFKSLPKIDKIEEQKIPKLIWTLLESFYPGNFKSVLKLLYEVEKTDNPEMVFYFLARHLKDVYWAKVDAKNMPYPPWRSAKLSAQARKYKDGKL